MDRGNIQIFRFLVMLRLTTQSKIILIYSFLAAVIFNYTLVEKVLEIYPISSGGLTFIISLLILVTTINALFLSLISNKFTLKVVFSAFTLIGIYSSYFAYKFGIIIDDVMILNIISTDAAEASGLLTLDIILISIFAVIAVFIISKVKIPFENLKKEAIARLMLLVCLPLVMVGVIFLNSAAFASFFREHKEIRYYTNPITPIYSTINLLHENLTSDKRELEIIDPAPYAKISYEDSDYELVILIVGETARSDRMSLNGYEKNTNPYTSNIKNIISYTNFWSCGTSTAVSVPCLFSYTNRKDWKKDDIYLRENVLDTLHKQGVYVEWRDNNSSSKGVADRIPYLNYRNADINPNCDIECRDIGMLDGLETVVKNHPNQDILIVLHAMGSHGPQYAARVPETYKKFFPECKTNDLQSCSVEEISNAYDNTIVYQDYLNSLAIDFLKKFPERDARFLYISDHGESLGEDGMYLHGYPYRFAPENQKKVAALTWAPQGSDIPQYEVMKMKHEELSHNNLACSLLELFEVDSEICSDFQSMFRN